MTTTFASSPKFFFTSESVTEGHPDKMCDQISDAVLDAIIKDDPNARVACETAATTGLVLVMGEITTKTYVDIPSVVRDTVRDIGYTRAKYGFDADTCGVMVTIKEQSPDIALGVDQAWEAKHGEAADAQIEATGAGDQGMMIGFACNETESCMPLSIDLAHKLCRRLAAVRKDGTLPYLRPDGKSQVTVEYHNGKPVRVDTVVISTQHSPDVGSCQDRDGHDRAGDQVRRAQRLSGRGHQDLRQPDRPLRDRRPAGRHRPDRPQDHRGHLRRRRPARRRLLLGQGPDEGGPLRGLHDALRRQEPGGRRRGRPAGDPGQLRHRRGPPCRASPSRPSAPARSATRPSCS